MRAHRLSKWIAGTALLAVFLNCLSAAEQPARLRILGKKIVAPDGKTIRLRGFNHLWWGNPSAQDVANRESLVKAMQPAFDFGRKYNVPVYCGVYGASTCAPGFDPWLQVLAGILAQNDAHWSHWAWMVKSKQPVDDSFDCNTHKTDIYKTMKQIFKAGSTQETK